MDRNTDDFIMFESLSQKQLSANFHDVRLSPQVCVKCLLCCMCLCMSACVAGTCLAQLFVNTSGPFLFILYLIYRMKKVLFMVDFALLLIVKKCCLWKVWNELQPFFD